MKNLILIILSLSALQSRRQIKRDQLTGCDSKIFVEENTYRLMKINFQTACDNLQKCADDVNINKQTCLQNFRADQEKFCDGYTSFNLWRRRYCKKIAVDNLRFAYVLEESLFAGNALAFYATMESNSAICLGANLISTAAVCNDTSAKFTFIRLTDNTTNSPNFVSGKTFAIQNKDGKCVANTTPELKNCDFNDVSQHWTITNKGVNQVLISSGGKNLTGVSAAAATMGSTETTFALWQLTIQDSV
jgi:hypothetical protein